MNKTAVQTFGAVLAALVVFGVLMLGYQAVSGPSAEECLQQEFDNAAMLDAGLPATEIDEDC
jgi:hypothetical protein